MASSAYYTDVRTYKKNRGYAISGGLINLLKNATVSTPFISEVTLAVIDEKGDKVESTYYDLFDVNNKYVTTIDYSSFSGITGYEAITVYTVNRGVATASKTKLYVYTANLTASVTRMDYVTIKDGKGSNTYFNLYNSSGVYIATTDKSGKDRLDT